MTTATNRISFQYVKVGTSTYSGNADTVNVAFNKINSNFTAIANSLSNILVPIANQYTTGTVRVGQGINVTPDGVISIGQTVHVGAPGHLTGSLGDATGTLETDNNILYVSTGSFSPSLAFNPIFSPPLDTPTNTGTTATIVAVTTYSTATLQTTSSFVYNAAGSIQNYTSGTWVLYDTNYNAYPIIQITAQLGTTPVTIITLNTATAVTSSSVYYIATQDIWHRVPYLVPNTSFLPVSVIPYQVGNITYSYSTISQAVTVIGTTNGDLTVQPAGSNTVINSNLIINGALNLGAPLTVSTTTAFADYTVSPVGNILLQRPIIASSATTILGTLIATATLVHYVGGISLGPMIGAAGEAISTNATQRDLYVLPYGDLNIGDPGKAVVTNIYGNTNITGAASVTGDLTVDHNINAPVFRIPTADNQYHVFQNTATHDLQIVTPGNVYAQLGGTSFNISSQVQASDYVGNGSVPASFSQGMTISNLAVFNNKWVIGPNAFHVTAGHILDIVGGSGAGDNVLIATNNSTGVITITGTNSSLVLDTGATLKNGINNLQLTDATYINVASNTWKFDIYGRVIFPDSTIQLTAFTANPTLQGLTVTNNTILHDVTVQTTATVNGQLLVNNTATVSQDLFVSGSATISGNLTVLGASTIVNSTSTAVQDAVIDIGGGPNGTMLTTSDGLDKGIVLHYYNTQATRMFLGRDAVSGRLQLRDNIDPGVGPSANSDFTTGGVWGGATFGNLILASGQNATGYNNNTGDLQVYGGAAIRGDLWVGGSFNLQGGDITIGSATFDNGLTVAGSTSPGTKFFSVNTGGVTPTNTFIVDSASGNTVISGTLQVNGAGTIYGAATLQNTLSVANDFSVNTNKFTVASATGNTAIAGTLNVTAATNLQNNLNVGGTFDVGNNKFLVVASSGNTFIAGNVISSGTYALAGDFSVNVNKFNVQAVSGNTGVAGTLNVTGATGLLSTLNVTGATTLNSTLGIAGSVSVGSNVFTIDSNSGNTVIQGTVNATGATVLASSLNVTGASYLNSTANVSGDFTVNTAQFTVYSATGNFVSAGNGTVDGNLTVLNTATIGATLGVTGATTLNSTLAVASDFNIGSGLFTVGGSSGNTNIAGTVNVTGASSLTSSLYVGGIVTMMSGQTVNGQVAFVNPTNSVSTTTGALVVKGGVGVGGNMNVGGSLSVANGIIFGAGVQMAGSLQLAGNKFTVSSATGNTVIAGTLQLGSDFTINTNQFTVQGSTGNTVVAGTMQIGNNTTIAGTEIITGPNSVANSLVVKGYTTGDQWILGTNPTAGQGISLSVKNATGNAYSSYNVYASNYNLNINGNPQLTVSSTGVVNLLSATASTGTSTGGLVVAGGAGVGGSVNIGGVINVGSTATIGGSANITGNVTAVQGNFSGNVTDNNQRVLVNVVPSGSSGINISNLTKTGSTVTFTINNLGVNTLAGTTNNIVVSQSTGSVTVNLGTTGTAGTYAYASSLTTDQFGRVLSVTANTATGTGPSVLATSPTVNTPTIVGAFTTTAYTGYLYGNFGGQVTASTTLPGAVVTGTVPAAYTATMLTATQNFSISGDVSSPTVGFNGTASVILNATLATVIQGSGNNFVKIALDTKGRVVGNSAVTSLDIANTLGGTAVTNAGNVLVTTATNNSTYLVPFVPGDSTYEAVYGYNGHTFNPGTGVLTTPIVSITATNVASSTLTGALRVAGGAGIGGNLWVGGTTFVAGDLIVNGSQTFVNSTNIQTGDAGLYLSTASIGPAIAVNAGIFIGPPSGTFASLTFDGTNSWKSAANIIPSTINSYALGTNYYQWTALYAQTVYDNNNRVLTNISQGTGTIIVSTGATTKAIYLSPATTSVLGGVKIGSGLSVSVDGLLTTNAATMSTATSTALGVIKVGSYINLSSDATISLPQAIYNTSTVTFGTMTVSNSVTAQDLVANSQLSVAGLLTVSGATLQATAGQNLILDSGTTPGDGVYINVTNGTGQIVLSDASGDGLTISPGNAQLVGNNGGSSVIVGTTAITLTNAGQINAWTFDTKALTFPDNSTQVGAAISATVTATNLALGYVKLGNNVYGAGDGTISVHTATNIAAGAVKIGTGIYISADGTISIPAGGGGVASITAGTGTHITASTGTPVLYIGQAVETTSGVTFGSVTSTGNITDNGNRVITSVTPTGGAGINISSLTSTGPSSSWTINNLGVNSATGGTGVTVSASTGAVTFSIGQPVATTNNVTFAGLTATNSIYANNLYDSTNRVVTSVTPTAGTAINISSLTSTGPASSFTINNLGVTALTGAPTIKVSASTGSITITDVGVTSIQPGTGITVTANTGSVTVTNAGVTTFNGATGSILGVNSVAAGTNVAVSATTGSVTISVPNIGVTAVNGSTGSVLVVSSITAGTAMNVSATTGSVTINNLGVTSAVAGTGITVSAATGTVTFSNAGVTAFNGSTGAVLGVSSIAGTANQVTASASTGAVTLSLPQAIATSSTPQFAGLTIAGTGAVTIGSTTAGTMNNVAIGGTTATTAKVTGLTVGYASVTTTPFTATSDTYLIGVNRAGPVAITLPAGSAGRVNIIKDESGNASVNNITITPASGTIDGQASLVISANYAAYSLYSSGSNWFIH